MPAPRRLLAACAFPAALLLLALTLGGAGISGSSVSLHAEAAGEAEPLVGRAREIRFDEFYVRTPFVVRQAELGFPRESLIGVGEHDMGVLANLPVAGWQNAVRPHQAHYQVLGLEASFAIEWWLVQLVLPAVGVYALALACRARIVVAALAGLAFAFSPAMQWWTATGLGTLVGYGCLAGAAFVFATRARPWWGRVLLGAFAGWLGACFLLVLYLPWLVPVALVVGALVVALVVRDLDRGRPGRALVVTVLPVAGAAAVVAGVSVALFLGAHHDAMSAITNSVYPGQRRRSGGRGEARLLLGAPFDVVQALDSVSVLSVNGKNQAEAAGGIFLLAAVSAALLADARRAVARPWRDRLALLAVLVAGLGLVLWYLAPVPAAVGRLVGLDRVPSYRLLPPLALASVLALALFVTARDQWRPPLRARAALVGAGVFAAGTVWAAAEFTLDGRSVAVWQLTVLTIAFGVAVGLTLWRGVLGFAVLVALLAVGAAVVNPLQRGLDPLLDSPAAELGRRLRDRPGTGAVVFFANDPRNDIRALAAMTASGVDAVSGLNLYPNVDAWRVLDPDESDRRAWDRYANALWGVAPEGNAPRVFLNTKDSVIVMVDPCEGTISELGVRTVVSFVPLERWCLVETDRVANGRGSLFAYQVDRSRPRPVGASPGS